MRGNTRGLSAQTERQSAGRSHSRAAQSLSLGGIARTDGSGPGSDWEKHKKITVVYNPTANSAQVVDAESGELLPSVVAYWFAWVSFHRETDVYGDPLPEGGH